MQSAAELNLEEMKLGKLGGLNAAMPEVKEMARVMENDYGNTLYQLKDIANRKSLILPDEMNADGKEAYERLVIKKGADFDRLFASVIVAMDNNAIDMLEKEVINTHDTDIKDWAVSLMTVIKVQLTKAQLIEEKTKNNS